MRAKFNFLDRRSATSKAADELRRKFPRRSAIWINAKAQRIAGPEDITTELHAQQGAHSRMRGAK